MELNIYVNLTTKLRKTWHALQPQILCITFQRDACTPGYEPLNQSQLQCYYTPTFMYHFKTKK